MKFFWLVGARGFRAMLLTTLLALATLSALNLSSLYGLSSYVSGEVAKVPWDIRAFMGTDPSQAQVFRDIVAGHETIRKVETFTFLKIGIQKAMEVEIDGRRAPMSWLFFLASSSPDLMPPGFFPPSGKQATIVMLDGGYPFAPIARGGEIKIFISGEAGGRAKPFYDLKVSELGQIQRAELLKWSVNQLGPRSAPTFPTNAFLIVVSPEEMKNVVDAFVGFFEKNPQTAGYWLPFVTYLASIQRDKLLSFWDLQGSLGRIQSLVEQFSERGAPYRIAIESDLLALFTKGVEVAGFLRWVSLLISAPLLWVTWIFGSSIARLVALNERRLLGLLRLRGAPGKILGNCMQAAIICGGLLGGLLGYFLGPLVFLALRRPETGGGIGELFRVILDPSTLLGYVLVSVFMAWLAGRRAVGYVQSIGPREAVARVASSEAGTIQPRIGVLPLLSLLLGVYGLASWLFKFSGKAGFVDFVVSFSAPALFIYGFASVVAYLVPRVKALSAVMHRTAGRMSELAQRNIELKPHRVASIMAIAALVLSATLYPQSAFDIFSDTTLRTVKMRVGSDLNVMAEPADFGAENKPDLAQSIAGVKPLIEKIARLDGVRSAAPVYEFITSAVLPKNAVIYYLDTDAYLNTSYYENEIGVHAGFRQSIRSAAEGVVLSKDVADELKAKPGDPIMLELMPKPVPSTVTGVVNTLPGALRSFSEAGTTNLSYITDLFAIYPFVVGDVQNPIARELRGFVSRVILLIRVKEGYSTAKVEQQVRALLPGAPLRLLDQEVKKMKGDMFVSLSQENMRLYVLGGFLIALLALVSISTINFTESRRIYALLRLRGAMPRHLVGVSLADLLMPALLGGLLGSLLGLFAGFNVVHRIWMIPRQAAPAIVASPSFFLSPQSLFMAATLLALFACAAVVLSLRVYRKSARVALSET
jgi:hypothetical protein